MKTHDDQAVLEALQFLAHTGAQIDTFRSQLMQAADLAVSSFVECRMYGTDLYICVCLETDIDIDKTLTWWLDIRPVDEHWLIEASVLWAGREVVAQVPSIMAPDFRTVQRETPRMLKQLLDAGGHALVRAKPSIRGEPAAEAGKFNRRIGE
jgi:hypothetical protein